MLNYKLKNVLAVSINANGENSHISYRLYNSHQDIVLDSNIIKSNIKLQDVLDALDTVVLQNEMIDVISIALPGIMVEGNVYSGIIEGGNHQLKERLEKRYEKEISSSSIIYGTLFRSKRNNISSGKPFCK